MLPAVVAAQRARSMPLSIAEALVRDGALDLGADLREAAAAWLGRIVGEGGSAATEVAYERDLRQFLVWLAGRLGRTPCLEDLRALDAKAFRAFLASRRRDGVGSRSLARTLSSLRQFFRWLETSGRHKPGWRGDWRWWKC